MQTRERAGRATGRRRRAWLAPGLPIVLSSTVGSALLSAGMAEHTVVALFILAGVACGAAWQRLDRCDFVDRCTGPAVLVPIVAFLLLLTGWSQGESADTNGAGAGLTVGIVAGLILAEQWMRQRARP